MKQAPPKHSNMNAPTLTVKDLLEQFRDAMGVRGIIPPDELIADGKYHRCDAEGPGGKDDASYQLWLDGLPVGGFQNWRDGQGWEKWQADIGRPLTAAETVATQKKLRAALQAQIADEKKRHEEAQEEARRILSKAAPCTTHLYLSSKGVQAHGAMVNGKSLVLPLRDAEGVLHSLQFIDAKGNKRFLPGGRKKGCFYLIGDPNQVLFIAEGFATGASIHEATGYAVAVAFDAGNLLEVARALHAKYPDLQMLLCGDDDYRTQGNPGKRMATEAAQAVGGNVVFPDFGSERPDGATDFNDLHQAQGLETVHACIEAALKSPANIPCDAYGGDAENRNSIPDQISIVINQLANLHPLCYDQVRVSEAKRLNVRVSELDKAVEQARKTAHAEDSNAMAFQAVEPWPYPVDGAELLNELASTIHRFIVCDGDVAIAVALWCVFTWLIDFVQVAPLLVITAPEKRCGKSQLLSLIGHLCRRPLIASNVTPAAMFRVIELCNPTLLIDEADSFLKDNEALRGVIDSGHNRANSEGNIRLAIAHIVANDELDVLLSDSLNKLVPIQITISNRKIYIGIALTHVTCEDFSRREYISVLPLRSGYRDKDTLQHVLTNDYDGFYRSSDDVDLSAFRVVIPVSEIISAAFFDSTAHAAIAKVLDNLEAEQIPP